MDGAEVIVVASYTGNLDRRGERGFLLETLHCFDVIKAAFLRHHSPVC
jgi:hypothetical protein